jgi:hypothetical protein
MSGYSYKSIIDGGADTDLIYYNASIVAANQRGSGPEIGPPAVVRFNESRDAPIIKNASQYYFSIIRFAMNGPNKNLPLFIPILETNNVNNPVQTDSNRTIYAASIAYQREWYYTQAGSGAVLSKIFTATPASNPVRYVSETQNTSIAPVPVAPAGGFTKQDLSTRYYWVYTYKHWCDLVNRTLTFAMFDAWGEFRTLWITDPDIDLALSPFPYATFQSFLDDHDAPFIKYNEDTKLFEIYGDTRAFNVSGQLNGLTDGIGNIIGTNVPVPAFVPPAVPPAGPAVANSAPYLRLFFNSNLYGLFSNFNNTYFNAGQTSSLLFPLTGTTPVPLLVAGATLVPVVYTNEILFTNQNYTNILNNNPSLQGFNAPPPPAYNPFFLIPTYKQNLYWISKQDFNSTNSLWSPVQSIVFTSTLLPLKKEYTAQPIQLGESNAFTNTGSASAFEPIISDFVIDAQTEKAEGWRDFTLYEPTAEYKMVSLNASHDEIRNVDIQVYWKYRLTGELIPLTMFNCSDVSLKMMFRRADYRS